MGNHQIEQHQLIRAMRQRIAQLDREGNYWTDDERKHLRELFYGGIGITAIALELRRTESAVMQQIQSLNLYEKVRRVSGIKGQDDCLCVRCKNKANCQSFNPSKPLQKHQSA